MTDTKTYLTKGQAEDAARLITDINALEIRANELHLFPCARALNNAKNAAGWQLAGDIEAAAEASTHRD